MTPSDEVIEEIREARRRISKQCDHDPAKYCAYLRSIEHKYAAQIERYRREHGKPLVGVAHGDSEK